MKALKTFATIVLIAITVTSCKKNQVQTISTEKRVSKISYQGVNPMSFTYNNKGTLVQHERSDFKTVFEYGNTLTGWKTYGTDSYKEITKDLKFENGRIKSFICEIYKYGTQTFSYPVSIEYDAEGRINVLNKLDKYKFEYNNGNVSKITCFRNGSVYQETTFEYYYQEPNKFNIPLQEYFYIGHYLTAKQLMGKGNNNLIKKVSIDGQGKSNVTNIEYKTNSEGYVTQWTENVQINNNTPFNFTVDVTY